MMKLLTKILFLLLAGVLIFAGCRKFEEYPEIPVISYTNFIVLMNPTTGITERGVLVFDYKDGDGDLGLSTRDTLYPFSRDSKYYYNLIIKYYEKQYGVFVEVPLLSWNADSARFDTLTFNSRFPVLTPESGNQAIKGIFEDTLFIYNPLSDFDTIKFEAYIYDRALNQSNTIVTNEIVRVQ
ncbi:MAG: hypothetical protein KKF98_16410 [Bacteroidetes bacterium]|jgi:hypothetical protein|nr:hypothetical protein [Bacteroidota bacterium]